MVIRTRRSTWGASTLGCLFSILILMAVLYYGMDIGRTYWNYYKLIDEMGTSARFAETQTDEQIMKHLVGIARDLGLPPEAQRFKIQRIDHPKTVVISTKYTVTLVFPFKRKVVVLTPSAGERQF
jgi:hypothetical protein